MSDSDFEDDLPLSMLAKKPSKKRERPATDPDEDDFISPQRPSAPIDDDDDDDIPLAALAAKKKKASTQRSVAAAPSTAASAAPADDDDDDMPLAALAAKRKIKSGSSAPQRTTALSASTASAAGGDDDDDDIPLAALAKSRKKQAAVKREKPAAPKASVANGGAAAAAVDDDDDDDLPLSALVKKNPAKNKAPKAASRVKSETAQKKRKRAEPAAAVKQAKKPRAKAAPKKAAPKKSRAAAKSGPKKSRGATSSKAARPPPKPKELPLSKQLDQAMKAFKWWEAPKHKGDIKWMTLEHNGVQFPPAYVPHGVKLLYKDEPVDLTPEQEEVASFYAAMPLDGPQLGDPKTKPVFDKNFFKDFRKVLGKHHVVRKFKHCDFSRLRVHHKKVVEERKNRSTEEKEAIKKAKEEATVKYQYCLLDGHLQKLGNSMVEPPGLFRGRGAHPKTGCLKQRVMPEQITINVGENDPEWGEIVHNHEVTWLAKWTENIANNTKYVMLAASSAFKGQSDHAKYEKARKLKKLIGKIRKDYESNLKNKNAERRQIATAMWVIDRLALRVGGEKDDDEADTVGCCSLRVEHVKLEDDGCKLTLDFLGKDSMRHFQTYELEAAYGEIGRLVYKNFQGFTKKAKPADDVFDVLDPTALNAHLKTLMPGLSAKVFRTFNASFTLEQQLPFDCDAAAAEQGLESCTLAEPVARVLVWNPGSWACAEGVGVAEHVPCARPLIDRKVLQPVSRA